MNSAEFNMVLLLGTGVVALIGKYVYERVMTRIEDQQEREAAEAAKHGSPAARHS